MQWLGKCRTPSKCSHGSHAARHLHVAHPGAFRSSVHPRSLSSSHEEQCQFSSPHWWAVAPQRHFCTGWLAELSPHEPPVLRSSGWRNTFAAPTVSGCCQFQSSQQHDVANGFSLLTRIRLGSLFHDIKGRLPVEAASHS